MKTIFYIEPEGTVLAVFPDRPYKPDHDATVVCYSPTGQHSGLCPQYLRECRLAKQSEYQDLEWELENMGYDLEVVNYNLEYPKAP